MISQGAFTFTLNYQNGTKVCITEDMLPGCFFCIGREVKEVILCQMKFYQLLVML